VARKRILLVDDVNLFLELEKSFLRREEFEIVTARNGREALAVTRDKRPDLVLMDLHMPEMNGDECCRRIKGDAQLQAIPVVIITQGGREDELELCRKAGCDAILLKPITRHDLLSTVKRLLNIQDRATPRCNARLRVQYGAPPQELLQNYSVNLSTGGMFLETWQVLPLDTPITLEFSLGDDRTIRCQARVAWVNAPDLILKPQLPVGMGLQFIDIPLDQLHAIREFIEKKGISPSW
jgi:uncharacterized protein (TIGR02266 family)